jgi:hypothetical protein
VTLQQLEIDQIAQSPTLGWYDEEDPPGLRPFQAVANGSDVIVNLQVDDLFHQAYIPPRNVSKSFLMTFANN